MRSGDSDPAERLAAHDDSWAARYVEIAASLQRTLGAGWAIEHVGSTSVPGLVAQPVIDFALRLPDDCRIAVATLPLVRAGWTEPIVVGGRWATYLKNGGVRAAIGHLFTAEQWDEALVRLFSDWLRTHPGDRDRYANLKTSLVAQGIWGRDYTNAKAGFVLDIVNCARVTAGLPALPEPL